MVVRKCVLPPRLGTSNSPGTIHSSFSVIPRGWFRLQMYRVLQSTVCLYLHFSCSMVRRWCSSTIAVHLLCSCSYTPESRQGLNSGCRYVLGVVEHAFKYQIGMWRGESGVQVYHVSASSLRSVWVAQLDYVCMHT